MEKIKELYKEIITRNNNLKYEGITTVDKARELKEELEDIYHLKYILEERISLIKEKEKEAQETLNIKQKVKDFYKVHDNISKWFKTLDLGFNDLEDVEREKKNIEKLYNMSYELEEYYLYEWILLGFTNFNYRYKKK